MVIIKQPYYIGFLPITDISKFYHGVKAHAHQNGNNIIARYVNITLNLLTR